MLTTLFLAAALASPSPCNVGTIGVELNNVPRALRRANRSKAPLRGAVVAEVLPESPAASAGLEKGDILTAEKSVDEICELTTAIANHCGQPLQLLVRRGTQIFTRTVEPIDAASFYEAACSAHVASGCFHKGELIATDDPQGARKLYESACESGSGAGCVAAGRLYADVGPGAARRVELLRKGCGLRDGTGCADLAFQYTSGSVGVKADPLRATQLYVASCESGDSAGCYNVGINYDFGRGVPVDLPAAIAAYEDGCVWGDRKACTNLGFLYEQGKGVAKSEARAAELYDAGCQTSPCDRANILGCVNLARLYRDGRGVEKSLERSAELFAAVCEREPDPEDENSAANIARSCSILGAFYDSGHGVEADVDRGAQLSKRGCDSGDAVGCFNLAWDYAVGSGMPKSEANAADAFRKACDADDGESCYELASRTRDGRGVEADSKKAATLTKRACTLGFEKACAGKK